jgi:hypothetical protein
MSVKNVIKPRVKITLDKDRYLSLDFNALALMEEVLGESALDGSIFTPEKLRKAKYLRAILYAMLKSEDNDVSLEQVGKLMSYSNLTVIMEAVAKVLTDAFGSSEGGSEEEGNA